MSQALPSNSLDSATQEIIQRLIPVLKPIRIYLFGSRARGAVGPDSDYDFLFVVSDGLPPEARSGRQIYSALRGTGVAADIVVVTESQFNRKLSVVTSLPAVVVREGRVIYAA
jgi:predicted nucleotidyltransferase